MKIFGLNDNFSGKACIALGFFDCLHLGHAELIKAAKSQAKLCGGISCAVTFTNNPLSALGGSDKLVFTYSERLELFKSFGIDSVLSVDFTPEFMKMDRTEFLQTLNAVFDLRGIVCGHDYKFGRGAQGNAEFLRVYCDKNGIMCDIIPPVIQNGNRISSSSVRAAIAEADFGAAERLLGRKYFISGEVRHGRGVGKLFDYPTANVICEQDKLTPPLGVYATLTEADGAIYKSVTNIGSKPTFGESEFGIETFLCDYNGDLYGHSIKVYFVKRLREIQKFDSPIELGEQIKKDCEWR